MESQQDGSIEVRTYWDFCEVSNKKFRRLFFLQSLLPDVYYYYDSKQNCFCREITNVEGRIEFGRFFPRTFSWFQYKPLKYLLATYAQG